MATRSISRGCPQLVASYPSAARAFLQIAPRRTFHNAPQLDFLLPNIPPKALQSSWANGPLPSNSQAALRRAFATSPARRHTTAVFNPRKDDDGNDMNIEITPRASNRLREIIAQDSNPNLALRVQVESGGCHGFQYLMSLTTLPPLDPSAPGSVESSGRLWQLEEDDTVFAADDASGARVVMDGPSLELLKGSKIDFTMELIGSQFKIVDNPLATSSCGCGTSFDIKD